MSLGEVLREEEAVEVVLIDAGSCLFRAGDVADRLYVIVSGTLEARLDTDAGPQPISELGPGDVVGEIGVLTGAPRTATVEAITPAQLLAVDAPTLQRLLEEQPSRGEALAHDARERLRGTQVIERFTQTFGILDRAALRAVSELVEWVSVPAGSRLFAQGDAADAAYLVASGRLRAMRRGPSGSELEVGEVGRADLVGEMSLVDGAPRRASVYAVRDSQLIRFSVNAYHQLLERYPRIGLEVAKVALHRTQEATARHAARPRSIVVVPITDGVDLHQFAAQLASALGSGARCVSSADVDRELARPGIAQIADDDVAAFRLAYHLEELEERYRHLVYEIDPTWTTWSRRALRWADQILLVADADRDPAPGAIEQELWGLLAGCHHPDVSLVLLHPGTTTLPRGTATWLEPRSLASHHHVRRGDHAHLARLARLVAGSGTSVVLGGGGARGFAHLGVLSTMDELAMPIDMIAGTSIGAIMAAGPAMGWTPAEARQNAVDAFRRLFDYTLPRTSLLRGERITAKLQESLGDVDIADLWIPYFCVSTNLTHASPRYHERGSLARAIRASIAIPGVLPPVPDGGDLLVDGGVLENVPVDEMRRRNPTGSIIAVDVAPVDGPATEGDYGLSVSGWRTVLGRRRARPPSLLTTMVRSSLLASVRDRRRVLEDELADLYLDVTVDGGGLLDFSAGDRIADGAAAATREALERFRDGAADGTGQVGDHGGYVRTAPGRQSIVDPARRRRRRGVLLLTVRDLRHRAARFAAVIAGTSVVFTLLFLMTGLTEQFHREPRGTVADLGADGWLLREGASGAFTSAATMPTEVAATIEGATAAPIVVGRHSLVDAAGPTDVVVIGFASEGLGAPELADGRLPRGPDEVVLDRSAGLALGDVAQLGGERYVVTGRSDGTTLFAGMPLVFMPIGAAQDLLYRGQDLATAVLLDGPVSSVPDGFEVLEPSAVAEDALRPLERSISSVNLIRVLLWFVAAMIIGTMTYLSALERRRDVAVLKAIGASTAQLGASIALQGALVALLAAGIASVLQTVAAPAFPLEVVVPARALLQVPAIAVVVALLAGVVGLRTAVRTDPALAFSGPGA